MVSTDNATLHSIPVLDSVLTLLFSKAKPKVKACAQDTGVWRAGAGTGRMILEEERKLTRRSLLREKKLGCALLTSGFTVIEAPQERKTDFSLA